MTRTALTFNQALRFRRNVAAPYIDAAGATQSAPADTPRFDYDPITHAATGLIVGGATAPDVATALEASWESVGELCILHQFLDGAGEVRREAHFVTGGVSAVNSLLAMAVHHQQILVLGYIPEDDESQMVDYGGNGWAIVSEARVTETGDVRVDQPDGQVRITEQER